MDENKQAEPVAVVGETFNLFWIGSEPVADIAMRHNIKVGTKLYVESPAVAQSWELNEETAKFLADLILANDEPTPVTLSVGFIKDDEGKIQHGLRVHESEYPEEGAELLVESTPSPQKAPAVAQPPADVVRELVDALRQCHKTLVDVRFFVDERVIEKVVNAEIRAARALIKAKEHGL